MEILCMMELAHCRKQGYGLNLAVKRLLSRAFKENINNQILCVCVRTHAHAHIWSLKLFLSQDRSRSSKLSPVNHLGISLTTISQLGRNEVMLVFVIVTGKKSLNRIPTEKWGVELSPPSKLHHCASNPASEPSSSSRLGCLLTLQVNLMISPSQSQEYSDCCPTMFRMSIYHPQPSYSLYSPSPSPKTPSETGFLS